MNLTVRTITNEVADYYNIPVDDIYCVRRKAENIKCKHIAIHFIKHFTKMSLAAIGNEFPGRNGRLDHATILHAVKSVSNQYDTDRLYRDEINEIRQRLELLVEDYRIVDEEVYQENDFYFN